MRSNKKISLVITTALLLLPILVFAAAPNPQDTSGNYNMALISLVSLMIVLLLVIGILANTLRQLAIVVRDKNRKDKQAASNVVKTILLMLAFSIPALHTLAAGAAKAAAATVSGTISGIPANDFYAVMTVIILEIIVIFALVIYIKRLLRIITGKPELAGAVKSIAKKNWFWDKFNAAATLEQEKDILLDHNYDGIQELDNSLPP